MLCSLFHMFLIQAYVLLVLPNVKYVKMQICSRPSLYFFKNRFYASVHFYIHLKGSENQRCSGVCRGFRHGTLAWRVLIVTPSTINFKRRVFRQWFPLNIAKVKRSALLKHICRRFPYFFFFFLNQRIELVSLHFYISLGWSILYVRKIFSKLTFPTPWFPCLRMRFRR